MKHKFRKYIGKRGSALFMVLSVMTALIVTCLAMYFSVVSSRKTQYAIFNQQQSYQSALSLNESMLGGIIARTDDAEKTGFTALAEAVDKMALGDTITTKGNDYSSFDPAGSKVDEDQVGAYMAEITYLSDADEGRLYDFAVTTMVNGTETTVHQYVVLPVGAPDPSNPPNRPLPLFVASGLIPTSPALNGGYMYSDVFYDSEYTHFMPYGQDGDANGGENELKTMGNVYAAGSLTVNYNVSEADGKNHIGIAAKPHDWFIRKDLIMTNEKRAVNFSSGVDNHVYVGGDCIFKADSKGFNNCEIYVLGNLTIEPGAKIGNNVKIHVNGTITGTASGTGVSVDHSIGDYNTLANNIEYYTADLRFYNWDSRYESIPGIEKEVKANFAWGTETAQFKWSSTNQGCTVTGVTGISRDHEGEEDTYSRGGYRLIIDTGNDPNNVYTIRLKGYLDGGKTFSWCPDYWNVPVWVINRGKGSVVFEVEDGVTYENRSYKTTVMHENWAKSDFGTHTNRDQVKRLIRDGWIHYDCDDSCCRNELKEISGQMCERCGAQMYMLECSAHNLKRAVCLNDDCDGKSFIHKEEGGKIYSYGTCEYRINNMGNDTPRPNMNIFLVMCGQNSAIQFTPPASVMTTNGINESFSSFWGYIYAPYAPLNYSAKLQSGDKTQFVGGIAVGSFNLFGRNSYMPAYPDRLPEEIMSAKCREHPLPTVDGKSWKEHLTTGVTA